MDSADSINKNLPEVEKKVYDLISENDLDGLKKHYLENDGLKIDLVDDVGMTPLAHACYKGNIDMAQFLLDRGADVNSQKHEHNYTPLHFAALSGNSKLCLLLRDFGASNDLTNTVNRTPSQMAAFVGNHKCVAVINNYIPKSEIDYFTVPSGFETSPKLPPECASSLHKLVMQPNLYPVKIAMSLNNTLLDNLTSVQKVLELMSSKEMKRGPNTNEVIAFKLHYLSSIIGHILNVKAATPSENVNVFIKRLLRGKQGDKFLEMLLRDTIRSFGYKDSTLFRQMVTSLKDPDDSPPALHVISTAINGHRMPDEVKMCSTCREEGVSKKCSRCHKVEYCGQECQKRHWFFHKKECTSIDEVTNKLGEAEVK